MDFAKAIKETTEYADLNAAQARIKLDPTAQQLISDIEESQQRIQQAQAQGQPVQSEIQRIQLLQSKAQENETLKRFLVAQEAFGKVMNTANQIITDELFANS
jgi:cell fate (sporulation/competence/biofilm development) regulator YlbF (YheA/YmcA/DUF963 family)